MSLIHEKALNAARNFKRAEAELVLILQEVESSRVFLQFDCTSLFAYVVRILGLSEDVACNLIAVARKARAIPQLQSVIQEGSLTVSKARKIVPVLTLDNQNEWIEKAQFLSTRALECEVARIAPREAGRESVKPVAENRFELRMGISTELYEMLLRVQDLESQRTRRALSLEETVEAMAEIYLEKKDPLKLAERVLSVTGRVNPTIRSTKTVSAKTQHQVRMRDRAQCTHQNSDGKRCEKRRWIDLHHVIPRKAGGGNTAENLITLCSAHHRLEHA